MLCTIEGIYGSVVALVYRDPFRARPYGRSIVLRMGGAGSSVVAGRRWELESAGGMFYHDSCKWHSYANVIQLVGVHLSTFALLPSMRAF